MKIAALRAYAAQMEDVAKLQLSELAVALQRTVDRMTQLEGQARSEADRYLSDVRQGSTPAQASAQLDAMDQALAARRRLDASHAEQQSQWMGKREEVVAAMQYRKKLDLLHARELRARQHRQERQDQQLLDDRVWRGTLLQRKDRS